MSQDNSYLSSKIDLWRNKDLKLIDETFLQSITHIINIHALSFALEDNYNGYVMTTRDNRTYVYGETICQWLSLKHDPRKPQELEQLNGQRVINVDYGWSFFTILTESGLVYLGAEEAFWKTNNKLKLLSQTDRYKMVSCGHSHILLLRNDDKLMALGSNQFGQITGTSPHSYETPVDTGLQNVSKLACGWGHSLAITNDKKLYSWGHNHWGRLGLNDENLRNSPSLISFADGKIKDIACGIGHSLFLLDDGKLYGCGWNGYSQLGWPSDLYQKSLSPKEVPIDEKVVAIASGWSYRFSMAFIEDGSCMVWGRLGDEQLLKPTKTQEPIESFARASVLYFNKPLTFGWIKIKNH